MPVMVVGVFAMAATMQRVWTVSGDVAISTAIPLSSPVPSTVTESLPYDTVQPMAASVSGNLRSPCTDAGERFSTVTLPPQIAAMARKYEAEDQSPSTV